MTVIVSSKLTHSQYFTIPGKEVFIRGTNEFFRGKDAIITSKPAKTEIPKEDWEAILKYHANSDAILKGFLIKAEDTKEGKAKSKNQNELKTGFDGVDTTKSSTKPSKESK